MKAINQSINHGKIKRKIKIKKIIKASIMGKLKILLKKNIKLKSINQHPTKRISRIKKRKGK